MLISINANLASAFESIVFDENFKHKVEVGHKKNSLLWNFAINMARKKKTFQQI